MTQYAQFNWYHERFWAPELRKNRREFLSYGEQPELKLCVGNIRSVLLRRLRFLFVTMPALFRRQKKLYFVLYSGRDLCLWNRVSILQAYRRCNRCGTPLCGWAGYEDRRCLCHEISGLLLLLIFQLYQKLWGKDILEQSDGRTMENKIWQADHDSEGRDWNHIFIVRKVKK